MKITVLPANELTSDHVDAWSQIQQANGELASPFFRPEFTQAVAAVRDDVEVAVLEQHGDIVGFFPFQRCGWSTGIPVGGRLSDFHGLVARDDIACDVNTLLHGCKLSAWNFDHLLAAQTFFLPYHWDEFTSPFMDLSEGFDAYHAQRRLAHSDVINQTLRKSRKIEREVGPLRFVSHTDQPHVLDALVEWKSQQYHRTGATDVFAFDWTVKLLRRLVQQREKSFAGKLSALYVGEHLVAVHLGIRSRGVLNYWFPAYDPAFARYSPGLILLVELARAAPLLGVHHIDLGAGGSTFKTSFMSDALPVARGSVTSNPVSRIVRRGWYRTKRWLRSSPLRLPAQLAGRVTRPLRGWLAFH